MSRPEPEEEGETYYEKKPGSCCSCWQGGLKEKYIAVDRGNELVWHPTYEEYCVENNHPQHTSPEADQND